MDGQDDLFSWSPPVTYVLRKPAAVGETGLGKCNAIFNRCERKLKNSMLLGSVLYCRITSCLTSTVTKFFKRCTSFQFIEYPP